MISSSLRFTSRLGSKISSRSLALSVKYSKNGPAHEVYKLEDSSAPSGPLGAKEVELKFLAAPINPADINLAQGNYGKSVPLPAVGGNEGVAKVTSVGSGVSSLKVGDWVVPTVTPFGTWTQVARTSEDNLLAVRNDIPAAYAATLSVNPATAYRLLSDFANLKEGDWIIQNGATSMVGLAVVQLAKLKGIKTINIVRHDNPDTPRNLKLISRLGGDVNIPDSVLGTEDFLGIVDEINSQGGIKAAFNCIGGESVLDMARVLANNGTIVTYGGMSKKPVEVPEDLISSKSLKLEGFWMSEWYEKNTKEARKKMIDELSTLVKDNKIAFFYELFDLDDFPYALEKSQENFRFRKVVLNLDYPDRFAEHDKLTPEDYEVFETSV